MTMLLFSFITSLLVNVVYAESGGASEGYPTLFAYFETPLKYDVGAIGPSKWRDLDHIPGNQCGGNGQVNGFGQSPVIISQEMAYFGVCHESMDGYEPFPGTCSWSDIDFKVTTHGLSITPKQKDNHGLCSLGSINIPQSDKLYEATEIKIKLGSEHSIDGVAHSFELQILHQEESGETQSVLSFIMEISPVDWTAENVDFDYGRHPFIESLLDGWRAAYWETEDFCKNNPDGTGKFSINSIFEAKQKLVICPKPGKLDESLISRENPLPLGLFPNIYSSFRDGFGTYTYDGSLTEPPCTENVYWNLADEFIFLSLNQAEDLTALISCYIEKTTCKHASASSEFGRTNRPPQDLNGREIIHRCSGGANVSWQPQVAPKVEKYKEKEPPKPYYAMLFPWFITALAVVVFYLLTRYLHSVPYTAALFLLGTIFGAAVARTTRYDQLTKSTLMWRNIDGELLLVAFLPGLLFKDAYSLNVHLFQKSLGQTLLMAFPMVLGGTSLLALVAYYILPYEWSFNFCMTFGAILSATDPVAVSALLNELGAPPRLKMHISGESLLNDGSAIVFYAIFKALFLFELGLGGEEIGFWDGLRKFVAMSLGASVIGIAFGLCLSFTLFLLNRRFNVEESVVQVCATIAVAYLTFYVAEVLLHWSGVLAVVFCGVTTKFFGDTLIIDQKMMEKFWSLVEHLLNSVLFALGGLVWGSVISNLDESREERFDAKDWGYLLLIYLLMTVIRFFLFGLFFPIISRIGMKSNWKEMVFHSFGGLRGAVGIALAVALDSEVIKNTVRTDPRRSFTSELFGITGGISLLTLFINGVLSAPLLRKLGLNRASKDRTEIVHRYDVHIKEHMLDAMIADLGMKQFERLDFGLIKTYVPRLSEVKYTDIRRAIKRVKDSTMVQMYRDPYMEVFRPHFSKDEFERLERISRLKLHEVLKGTVHLLSTKSFLVSDDSETTVDEDSAEYKSKLKELRLVFIELLSNGYKEGIASGTIDPREGALDYILDKSVAISEDEVSNGQPIDDWKICVNSGLNRNIRGKIYLAAAFIRYHTAAQQSFKYKFCQSGFLSQAERQVLEESSAEVEKAELIFDSCNTEVVRELMSLRMCRVLLNKAAILIGSYEERGLLKTEECEHFYEEFEHAIQHIGRHVFKSPSEEENESLAVAAIYNHAKVSDDKRDHAVKSPSEEEKESDLFVDNVSECSA